MLAYNREELVAERIRRVVLLAEEEIDQYIIL